MKRIDVVYWYKIAAFAYGMGTWTFLGCLIHHTHPEWFQFKTGNEKCPDHLEREIYRYGNWETIIYRKKGAVPLSTRVSNYIQSFRGGSETKVDDE